ncbi:MAG: GNAT family N-acetyltransferase [Bryobacteraceae bacterium]
MGKRASFRIEVVLALPEQQSIFANLLELYAHDFSEFHNLELGPDGRFGYKPLPLYWSDPTRHPFLVKVGGQLAGFVFVKREGKGVWDVAEFFIARAYRRKGIGMKVAHEVWKRFPGLWEVRVMELNHRALNFWQRAIAAFHGDVIHPIPIEKDGESWRVFAFESKGS